MVLPVERQGVGATLGALREARPRQRRQLRALVSLRGGDHDEQVAGRAKAPRAFGEMDAGTVKNEITCTTRAIATYVTNEPQ